MTLPKVRKTVTLDPEVVEALGGDLDLSTAINEILRTEVERRQRASALTGLLARLDHERGAVDRDEVEDFWRLLR